MSLNHEALKQRRTGARAGAGWRVKEGENRIRVLPAHSKYLTNWAAMLDIAVAFKIHFFRVEGRPVEFGRCLEELKQTCPACAAWRTYRKSDDPSLKELAKQIAPADQYLMNVLDLNNLAAGIQQWTANFTCWDKILEIVANPQWGNVLDPVNGINFTVTMTPGNRSRTGFNQYSVTPEPQRTDVSAVLNAVPNWQAILDSLVDHVTGAKEVTEMQGLLKEMGIPETSKTGAVAPAVQGVRPVAPAAVAGPLPAAAVPIPVPAPTQVPGPTPAPAAPQAPEVTALGTVRHYDPGPQYVPKVPEAERPANAPRCFGDYNPVIHQCRTCPVMTACQMKMVGVA